jgi:hypothetical protein
VENNPPLSINEWYSQQLEKIRYNDVGRDMLCGQDLYSMPLSINEWYCKQLERIRDNDMKVD